VNDDQQDVGDDRYNLEVVVYQVSVFSWHANLHFGINYVAAANPNIIESHFVINCVNYIITFT
jgi:hypothetical protein